MAYIVSGYVRVTYDAAKRPPRQISVNASILSQSGGPCVCSTNDLCTEDTVYLTCVEEVRRELITTTAAISALASAAMGLIANLPIGMAPGLGMNAYVSSNTHRSPRRHSSHGHGLRIVGLLDSRIPRLG